MKLSFDLPDPMIAVAKLQPRNLSSEGLLLKTSIGSFGILRFAVLTRGNLALGRDALQLLGGAIGSFRVSTGFHVLSQDWIFTGTLF